MEHLKLAIGFRAYAKHITGLGKEKRMKQSVGKLVLHAVLAVLFFAVFFAACGIDSASASQNATFATRDVDENGTTNINIGWSTGIVNKGNHSVHVDTSGATTRDYAVVGTEADFELNAGTTISYWGYTNGSSNVDAPDELFLMLDTNDDGDTDVVLGYTYSGGSVGTWVQFSFNGTTGPLTGWYTVNATGFTMPVNITDYYGNKTIDVALGAGAPTSPGGVTVDVYLDNLTVNGNTFLDDDTGFIEVHYGRILGIVVATSIQDAINAALPGDTIVVYNGTYIEDVLVNKRLTLRGEGANVVNVAAASVSDHVFNVTADWVNISGFTVTGATGGGKAGIYLSSSQHCNISDNNVSGNDYGIYLTDSSNNTLTSNTISDNTVGVYAEGTEYFLTVEDCEISDNAEGGIGCFVDEYLEAIIVNNDISNNSCSGDDTGTGGGIRLHGTDNTVSVINATIVGNDITNYGYGGHVRVGYSYDYATANISYVTLTDNYMEGGQGSSMKLHASEYLGVYAENNSFINTSCTNKIGYADYDAVRDIDAAFIGNRFSNDLDDDWGSLLKMLAEENVTATITDNTFEGSWWGTLRIGWVCGGGPLTAQNVTATIADNAFENNHGGAILTKAENNLDVAIYDNYIDGTACSGDRSAVEVVSDNLIHAGIYNNTISDFSNSGIYVSGYNTNSIHIYENDISQGDTGIYLECNDGVIENNTIYGNEVGIWLDYSNNNTFMDNIVTNNGIGGFVPFSSSNDTRRCKNVSNKGDKGVDHGDASTDDDFDLGDASSGYGIYLNNSNNNTIYNNYFSNTYNAWDNANNTWNITKQAGTNIVGGPNLGGNYWSDYAGVDNDRDGLGDTLLPYNSSGNITNGGDWHPLVSLVHIALRGTDNGVWYINRDSNGSWNSWQLVQNGYTPDTPALTSTTDGTVHIAVWGMRGGVWYNSKNVSGNWNGWELVESDFKSNSGLESGYTSNPPALTSTPDGSVHLSVRGMRGGVWYNSRNASTGNWNGWELVQSGYTQNSPALTSTPDGSVHLTARGLSDGVWYINRNASGNWSGWQQVQSGYTLDTPAVTSTSDGTVHLTVRGTDNGVWYINRNASGNWTGWEQVQIGYTLDTPAVTSTSDGTVHLAVRGTDDGVWYINRNASGNWTGWEQVQSGYTLDTPAVTSTSDGAVHVAVRGVDDGVWYNRRSSGNWTGWQHVQSGYTYNSPAVTS